MITKALAMVALLTIGVTFAYAETSTVEVPFDSHGQSCWYDEISIEYHCTWQGIRDTFTIEDLKEFKSVLSEETYNRSGLAGVIEMIASVSSLMRPRNRPSSESSKCK